MLKRKKNREKGKISFTRYFQKFKEGDKVAIAIELSQIFGFPKRIQGRTGTIVKKQGNAYIVEMLDIKKLKTYAIKPIHLKKLK